MTSSHSEGLPNNLPPVDTASALLGFNEPNIGGQAEMTPAQAAEHWPAVVAAASDRNIPLVVSPAMTYVTTAVTEHSL